MTANIICFYMDTGILGNNFKISSKRNIRKGLLIFCEVEMIGVFLSDYSESRLELQAGRGVVTLRYYSFINFRLEVNIHDELANFVSTVRAVVAAGWGIDDSLHSLGVSGLWSRERI